MIKYEYHKSKTLGFLPEHFENFIDALAAPPTEEAATETTDTTAPAHPEPQADSEPVAIEEKPFFLGNSLQEKRKYIYFRRGPMGSTNYECGKERFKMKKENFDWEKLDRTCGATVEIFKIIRK